MCGYINTEQFYVPIQPPNVEKTFDVDAEAKGIRLDVYTKSSGKIYDLEMQTVDTLELPKRARYYQGVMDVDSLKVGEMYKNLNDSYVIFLCLDDIFHHGLPVYSFQNRCDENPDILLDDKTYKIFFNAKKYDKMSTEEERDFFAFLSKGEAGSDFTKELNTLVVKVKKNAEWRKQFMTWGQELQLEHEKAFEEGVEQGKLETAKKFLKMGLPEEQVSEGTGLPLEKVKELIAVQ